MPDLSERQAKLLQVIIDEYVATAEPVGSETIVKKFDLGVSPATIRNDMVRLAEEGYLEKSYSSSGRVPTPLGFRFYIKTLMAEKKLPVASEVALRQRLYEKRFKEEDFLRDAVSALATETNKMAMGSIENGPFYYAGIANILDAPEFFDIDLTKTVLGLLDQQEYLWNMLSKVVSDEPVTVLIGDESGMQMMRPCSIVFSKYQLGNREGYVGILGPARMKYPQVVPTVRYIRNLIEELLGNW
ncbi:hypothetical protein A2X44_02580 [candidate division CPR3 bacterium GWF2_35_18]|uniref:Heat-inducible transcription repressor HrcA n=1 Tax=candidate division CPR3 bacterium GW2011_GWF2_35_18 TaxID=1618350 RepID=A0A0G0E244_UNCC3|nr:MAG: Heat-inducible transcription repressor HrcA [candidate division CPR3 bacterium GW2011_GWF2_35_18]KKP85581.1 MAG: Heat-inducible transcription repressor HrcA [candidate division CPR3 bacterium GW2011_GWE2_35_7]OGB62478.1 MAG: hypothetical protein A2X44_02580 [candidate division CPR3 bacterium GWF2_35_18]OGB65522.1 MAG: hypothetical protein A2250_04160 [candidate division CPR3 bacterium RIFOXYA2_FULL_35_13]OGB79441.1 MAG: hypothetical protein A2296_03445 [candidate division CPR3 bacterium